MKKVILNPKRERSLLRGHPWIFSGAIRGVEGDVKLGETVAVQSAQGDVLGYGAYSPASNIRVRMLSFDARQNVDAPYIANLVANAVKRRTQFWESAYTNGVRLINAESDGLPGVIADCYDGWIVVQLAFAGAEYWKDVICEALIKNAPNAKGVWNRSDVDARTREGLELTTGLLAGDEPPELIAIHEGAMRFYVDVRKGHKTGFYLDQRDARKAVATFAKGKEMLNCFSYTGGFGLAAREAGASEVTQLDISEEALALAQKNEALNAPCATQMIYTRADVFKQLRLYRDQGRTFDLIVLDPPKFADTKGALMRATRGYKDINLLAMKLLRPGGILATFSCSGAVSANLFEQICAEAATDSKRTFQIIARTGQALDHPVSLAFPEGTYLKGLILRA